MDFHNFVWVCFPFGVYRTWLTKTKEPKFLSLLITEKNFAKTAFREIFLIFAKNLRNFFREVIFVTRKIFPRKLFPKIYFLFFTKLFLSEFGEIIFVEIFAQIFFVKVFVKVLRSIFSRKFLRKLKTHEISWQNF
jgi:hypothetical protein